MDIYDNNIFNIFDTFNKEKMNNCNKSNYNNSLINININAKINITNDNESNITNFECINCGIKQDLVLYDGTYICTNCDMVYDRVISDNQEWRYYGNEDNKNSDPSRCGMPVNELFSNIATSSYIGKTPASTGKVSYQMYQLVKYQQWSSISYKDRNFYNTIEQMSNKALNNGLPKTIIDDAQHLYKKISEEKISRGFNRDGLLASSIYIACRKNNVPRSAKEIATMFNVKLDIVTRNCKKFNNLLTDCNIENETTPYNFLPRFCCKLKLEEQYINFCKYLLDKDEELMICSENSPNSVASGAIFYMITVLQLPLNKKDVAVACEISEITINKCFKKFCEFNSQLLSTEIIQLYKINMNKIQKKIKNKKDK
jgi:transcription initiation factor TFIIB